MNLNPSVVNIDLHFQNIEYEVSLDEVQLFGNTLESKYALINKEGQSLIIRFRNGKLNSDDILSFYKLFWALPNLRSLNIDIDNVQLSNSCTQLLLLGIESFPRLSKLHISISGNRSLGKIAFTSCKSSMMGIKELRMTIVNCKKLLREDFEIAIQEIKNYNPHLNVISEFI